jgi:hypothetical protein
LRTSASVGIAALALALAAGAGWATQSRQDTPESILPPGFNDPVTPAPAPRPTPAPGSPAVAPPPSGTDVPAPDAGPLTPPSPTPTPTPSGTPEPIDLSAYELPPFAKRGLNEAGAIGRDSGGIAANGWGQSDGRAIERLMRTLDAPLPSRWLSIALRRALASRTDVPTGVNGADFAAERAWLLIRMGEAPIARSVVQSVDVDNYTPKLFQVAMQAMLATADPAGLCPLVEPASKVSYEAGWSFARPICSALAGRTAEASQQFNAARRRTGRTLDVLLAEKVLGAAAQGRAVTVEEAEWNQVSTLSAWRYGMATATGVAIPDALFAASGAQVAGWRATAPMLTPTARAASAELAAAQGVLSNLALIDLFSAIEAEDDQSGPAVTTADGLRNAYEGTPDARLSAMRTLWTAPEGERQRFARLVLTARAAAAVPPDSAKADDAPRLIASMLTAGLDEVAARWRSAVAAGSEGWAMLALADPRAFAVSAGDVQGFASDDPDRVKARLLFAGLAGLGRLSTGDAESLAQSLNVRVGAQNSWTRAIDGAAERGEQGTVLLLAAVGMQTTQWRGVPAEVLYHSIAGLRRVGLDGEARMIAAEAIARL